MSTDRAIEDAHSMAGQICLYKHGFIWVWHPKRLQLYGIIFTIEFDMVITHYVIMAVMPGGLGTPVMFR